jgi:hypothetical protein
MPGKPPRRGLPRGNVTLKVAAGRQIFFASACRVQSQCDYLFVDYRDNGIFRKVALAVVFIRWTTVMPINFMRALERIDISIDY